MRKQVDPEKENQGGVPRITVDQVGPRYLFERLVKIELEGTAKRNTVDLRML